MQVNRYVRVGYSTDVSPPTWTELEFVRSVEAFGLQSKNVESTVYGPGSFERSIPGYNTVTDAKITLGRVEDGTATGQDGLEAIKAANASRRWRIEKLVGDDTSVDSYTAIEVVARIGDFMDKLARGDLFELEMTLVFDDDEFYRQTTAAASEF